MRILVVEDDPVWVTLLAAACARVSIETEWAETPRGALHRLSTGEANFPLIVLDVGMLVDVPNADVIALCRHLREQHFVGRVITWSALGSADEIATAVGPALDGVSFEAVSKVDGLSALVQLLTDATIDRSNLESDAPYDEHACERWSRLLTTPDPSGRELENLVAELLRSTGEFDQVLTRFRTATGEFDVVAARHGSALLDRPSVLIVECKDVTYRPGSTAPVVHALSSKMESVGATKGIVVSRSAPTGDDRFDAVRAAQDAIRLGRTILFATIAELAQVACGQSSLSTLLSAKLLDTQLQRFGRDRS